MEQLPSDYLEIIEKLATAGLIVRTSTGWTVTPSGERALAEAEGRNAARGDAKQSARISVQ